MTGNDDSIPCITGICTHVVVLLFTLATQHHLFELSNPSYEYIDDNKVGMQVSVNVHLLTYVLYVSS